LTNRYKMNAKQILFKQLDGLYEVQEIDMELFSKIDENGNLQIDEDGILIFRIHRMIQMFHNVWSDFDGENIKKAAFVNSLLDWIIKRTEALEDCTKNIKERNGLAAFAMVLKFHFDMFINELKD